MIIRDAITQTQNIDFFLDGSKDAQGIKQIPLSGVNKTIDKESWTQKDSLRA